MMKNNKLFMMIITVMMLFNYPLSAENHFNIDFTLDSIYWGEKFPALSWNAGMTDYSVSGIDNLTINSIKFKGAYGKYNPSYAQPLCREDHCMQHVYSFRLGNSGNSYIEFPEYQNAGQLTIHNRCGNLNESGVFYIEKFVNGKWERIRTLASPAHGGQDYESIIQYNLNIDSPVKLRVYGASKNVHIYAISLSEYDPALVKEKGIRLISLPDTQSYTRDWPYIFHSQTAWCVNNADSISFVIHEGDITTANNAKQWPVAVGALSLMDNIVPYTFCPGNHDIGTNGSSDTRNTTMLNQYLPYRVYSTFPGFGGVYEVGKMENSWHTFSTPEGYNFLIVSMEFAPRNGVLQWAGNVIAAHPKHNVVINTHAYMYSDDKRISNLHGHKWTPSTYGLFADSNGDANDGEEIWTKLVKLYPNIFMVVSGHVLNDGTGRLVSEGDHGNKVYQMLANYQTGVIGVEFGGNGFLRIIDLDPVQKTIKVRSYSPFVDEYKTEEDQQFSFEGVELIKSDPAGVNILNDKGLSFSMKKNVLHIQVESEDNISVNMFDLLGHNIFSKKKVEKELILPNNKGCYIIQVSNENVTEIKKVIIR